MFITSLFDETARRASHALLGICLLVWSCAAFTQPAQGYSVVHSFLFFDSVEGHGPSAAMAVGADGNLFGAAFFGGSAKRRCQCVLGGAVFSMTPDGNVTKLHAFSGMDGVGPMGQLVQGPDGLWYGLTLGGGEFGLGTAFRVASNGSRFEVLHSFGAASADGRLPSHGPLALAPDGNFYGATSQGGTADKGTLFRMTPDGQVTTLHSFAGSPADGSDPQDQPIVASDGALYGATTCGGANVGGVGCGGTLYRLSGSGAYALVHEFGTKHGGYHPLASPIQVAHRLLGTTAAGGSGDFGTVYRIEMSGTGFVKLHEFGGGVMATPRNDDGARPVGRLLAGSDGLLYGTTSNGGPHRRLFPAGEGTFFRITMSGDYALVGTLGSDDADASHPVAGLVEGKDGYVYGTTDNGGKYNSGTVFRFEMPGVRGANREGTTIPGRTQRRDRAGRTRSRPRDRRNPIRRWPMVAAAALATTLCTAHAQPPADMVEYSKAWSLVVEDFDGDGHEDIFIAGHDQEDRIWYGSPTGYRPGPQPLAWQDRHGCVAADVDRDGRLDLFCAIGVEKGTGTANNELWHQAPGGVFTSVQGFGAEDPYGRGRKPVFLDLNHDGWPDLYVSNESELRSDGHDNFNRMFLNRGDGTFAEVSTIATGRSDKPGLPGSQCVARGDADGDGWDDLLVCGHDAPASIFINNHANDFVPLASPAMVGAWREAMLVDMNADGRADLVNLTTHDRLQIWLNTGVYPYYVVPTLDVALPAQAVSLATGRFDGDARKDVYVVLRGDCVEGIDDEPDAIFRQYVRGSWVMERLSQPFGGCGYMAATVEGTRVLLANGTTKKPGPNYLLSFESK